MAQLVEHWSTNRKVVGSNPTPVEVFSDFDYTPSPGVILTSEFNSKGGLLQKVSLPSTDEFFDTGIATLPNNVHDFWFALFRNLRKE